MKFPWPLIKIFEAEYSRHISANGNQEPLMDDADKQSEVGSPVGMTGKQESFTNAVSPMKQNSARRYQPPGGAVIEMDKEQNLMTKFLGELNKKVGNKSNMRNEHAEGELSCNESKDEAVDR